MIVGAAIASHHPGLMQCEEFRVLQGAGRDSDLIAGYERLRRQLDAVRPDVLLIFDTHWFTTGYHLVDGGRRYQGRYVSDEMPWYLYGVPYDYEGCPELARAIEQRGRAVKVPLRAVFEPDLARHYPTINLVAKLGRGERVVSVSTCQNCRAEHFLQSGAVIGEALRDSPLRVAMLASGALSHRFNPIDWVPRHPRIFDESNVATPENAASDKAAVELFREGRHDLLLQRWEAEFSRAHWEGFGGHYLQMVAALGGEACRTRGTPLSDYENARGTGNIHIWFDVLEQGLA